MAVLRAGVWKAEAPEGALMAAGREEVLMEMVRGLILIAILSAIALGAYSGLIGRQNFRKMETHLRMIRTAERLYFLGAGNGTSLPPTSCRVRLHLRAPVS